MAKSMVERYEQLLAQDPASSVFVELAKVLIAQGEHTRAIDVCEQGVTHHPTSVTGRVLWGKALIHLGRPVEAMAQFDQAISLDKENPHAYKLIAEVLLQRGLYRSALPILKKAAALQPNDGRVQTWLEQTQAALSGGPAPAFGEFSILEAQAEAPGGDGAAAEGAGEAPAPGAAPATGPASEASAEAPGAGSDSGPAVGSGQPQATAEKAPSGEAPGAASQEAPTAGGGGLLGDLSLPDEPTASPRPPALKRGLLDDLPEAAGTARPAAAASQDAKAIAAAYERELREKLIEKGVGSSAAAGRKLKLAVGVLAVLVVGIGALLAMRMVQGEQTLEESLAHAERLIAQDTRPSLQEALTLLSRALEVDDDNSRAWALSAYARGLLYADHGAAPEERAQALTALERPGVRTKYQGIGLATDVLVADERGREPARRALLDTRADTPEVHTLAGSLLLESGKDKEAVERFKRAIELSSRSTRTLVALGNYYRDSGDYPNALRMYASAREISLEHPMARIGAAESRLAMGQELPSALDEMAGLAKDTTLSVNLRARQRIVHARLLAALGRHDEARTMLGQVAKEPLSLASLLALGAAGRATGDLAAAQRAFEEAFRLKPDSEEAKVGLAQVLLDRDLEKELLSKLGNDDSKKVALLRGAAYARLGDWKRARAELARTQVEERYPPEAVISLALADAAEGQRKQALAVLEKMLAATKRARSDVRVALGRLYWQEKALDKASAQFEAAVALEDPLDYEAPCALGRLLVERGLPDMAVKPLTQAVARNGSHGEAREALGWTLLALGRTEDAIKQFEGWQQDNPGSAAAHKGLARALLHAGRVKDAEAAAERASKLATDDEEAHRVRAAILFAMGNSKGAFSALERANKLNPKSPETFCEIAHAFLRQGNTANATAAFAAARREGPDTPCGLVGEHYVKVPAGGRAAAKALQDIAGKATAAWDKAFAQTALARVLLGAGELQEARKAADEAVRLAPFSGRSHLALGLVAQKQQDAATAKKSLARAVELEPGDGMAHLALADALAEEPAEQGRVVEAYNAFLRLAGASSEAGRVKRALPALERQVAR